MNNYKDDGEEIIVYNNFMNTFHLTYLSTANAVISLSVVKSGIFIFFFRVGDEVNNGHSNCILYSEKRKNV